MGQGDGTADAGPAAWAARAPFGALPDGRPVEVITLANRAGITARVLSYGAILQALLLPDRAGRVADVVAGHADLAGYLAQPNYFGAVIGRYANRIAGARFALDGAEHRLAANNGANSLHGGEQGFDKRLWQVLAVDSGEVARVVLALTSAAGEEGFPGTLAVTATYTLDAAGILSLDLAAATDAPTVVNLTGHAWFNLAGEGTGQSTAGHLLTIPANAFTPVDAALIPTGELRPVAGTPFDFRAPTPVGARWDDADEQLHLARGYDHNWVIADPGAGPADAPMLHARLAEPGSGRALEVWSTMPGLQFYSGNFLDGSCVGKSGRAYPARSSLCLEPQLFPDTPNQPAFGSARLDPGETYRHRIEYRLSSGG